MLRPYAVARSVSQWPTGVSRGADEGRPASCGRRWRPVVSEGSRTWQNPRFCRPRSSRRAGRSSPPRPQGRPRRPVGSAVPPRDRREASRPTEDGFAPIERPPRALCVCVASPDPQPPSPLPSRLCGERRRGIPIPAHEERVMAEIRRAPVPVRSDAHRRNADAGRGNGRHGDVRGAGQHRIPRTGGARRRGAGAQPDEFSTCQFHAVSPCLPASAFSCLPRRMASNAHSPATGAATSAMAPIDSPTAASPV